METVLQLIKDYGLWVYLILFSYTALKSGWLPLFAGYAAYAEALNPWIVAACCFAGGYLGDELRFYVSRRFGNAWIQNKPRLKVLYERAKLLANQYGGFYIFFYRYPKGLRTIGALPIGLTKMSWPTFTLLNASSALLWVILLVGGGYSFGASFEAIGLQNLTAFSILLLAVFLISLYRLWKRADRTTS